MRKYLSGLLIFTVSFQICNAQDSTWTLQRCVQYALAHSTDINQSALNARMAKLQYNQSRLSQLPNVSASGSYGYSWGRSIDPTSNSFVNNGYYFSGLSGNADVLLFGWFSKSNQIKQNNLLLQAANADLEQLKNDISLNVATGFLRILLAKEQIGIANDQLQLSLQQQAQTKAFVDAGSKPELDLMQLNAQVANDSAAYISAVGDYHASILDMKALLNLDMQQPFEANLPNISQINMNALAANSAQQIFEIAKQHFASIKSTELKIQAAQKGYQSAKGNMFPQLSFGYQIGSNYASSLKQMDNMQITGAEPNGTYVNVNGTNYSVMQPTLSYSSNTIPFFKQMGNNFRQSAVLSINIPLFNGWSARTAIKQAQIDIESKQLAQYQNELKLQQDVFKAYNDVTTAIQKYNAANTSAIASKQAYEYAQKRYGLGLINSVDLLSTQNTYAKAASTLASAKYDMIFKLKVIDYYLGNDIKL